MGPHTVPLGVVRLHSDAALPALTSRSICLDVHAYLKSESGHLIKMAIAPGITRMVPTGIRVTPGEDYTVLIANYLGLAARGIRVANTIGPVDHNELMVWLHNSGPQTEWIEHNDPIAQLVLVPLPTPIVVEEPDGSHNMPVRRAD